MTAERDANSRRRIPSSTARKTHADCASRMSNAQRGRSPYQSQLLEPVASRTYVREGDSFIPTPDTQRQRSLSPARASSSSRGFSLSPSRDGANAASSRQLSPLRDGSPGDSRGRSVTRSPRYQSPNNSVTRQDTFDTPPYLHQDGDETRAVAREAPRPPIENRAPPRDVSPSLHMDRRDTSDRLSEYATLYEKAAGQVRKPSPSSSSRNPSDYRSSNYRSPPRSQDGRDSGSSTDSFTRRTSLSTDYHPPHTRPPVPIAAPRVPSSPPRQFVGTPPRQMPGTPPRPNPSTPPRQVADSSQRGSRGLLDTDPGARRRSIVGPASTTSSPAHSRSRSRSPHGLGGIISSAIGLSSSRPPPLPLLESTRSDSPPTYSQDEHHQPAAKRDLLATPSNVPTSPDADDASATLMFTDDVDGDIMPGHWQESQRRRRPSNASLGSGDNGAVGGSRERRPSNASDRSLDYTGLSAAYIARAAESRHSVLNSIPETEAAGTWAQQDGSLFDDLDDLPEVNLASVEEVFNAINTLDRTYLIDTLCRTPPDEVARLAMTYRTIHNESPARAIKSRLGGLGSSLLQVLEGCAMGLLEYHIKLLRDSLRASDTDGLTEILAGATLDDLRALKSAYQQVTGVALEVDIHRNSRGLIVSLFDAILNVDRRSAGRRFDPVLDAQDLYEAGEARIGKDQVPFFRILTERSDDHLRQVFDVYERMYGKTIDKVIESEFMINPHTCRALLVLVRSAINRVEEVADMIQTSLGSAIVPVNTTRLTRLVVRYRTPDDRQRVKSAYRRLYGRTLASRIRERTYGDYRLALLACLDEPLEGI